MRSFERASLSTVEKMVVIEIFATDLVKKKYKILGSYCACLGYEDLSSCRWELRFRKKPLPPPSGQRTAV